MTKSKITSSKVKGKRRKRKPKKRIRSKKEKELYKQGYRYHGYSKEKKSLRIRKRVYRKKGWSVRSIKTRFPTTGKRQYIILAKKK